MALDNTYYRPTTIEDALNMLSSSAAIIAAGCTDLFPLTSAPQMTGQVLDVLGLETYAASLIWVILDALARQQPDGYYWGRLTTIL